MTTARYPPSVAGAADYRLYDHNQANQLENETIYGTNPAWDGHTPVGVAYTANGLNQYTQVNSNAYSYDANGNLIADGTDSFTYDPANRLIAMPSKGATLAYDPLGRLHSVTNAAGTERFLYDGNALIMEFNASGGILARHVHGLSAGDDPLASYTGSLFDASNEQLIRQDRLGSVLMMSTDRTATTVTANTYDEYGVPGSGNVGRFQYTGQVWLEQLGLYHYKARTYSPTLGRFLQTDPIGYGDGLNMYAYVGSDPVNGIDPFGEKTVQCYSHDWSTFLGTIEVGDDDDDEDGWKAKCTSAYGSPGTYIGPGGDEGNSGLGDYGDDERPANRIVIRGKRPTKKENPCDVALRELGGIETAYGELAFIGLIGLTGSIGRFRNVRTGTTGYFTTIGAGAGLDIGVSAMVTGFGSLQQMVGFADAYNVSLPSVGGYGTPSTTTVVDLEGNVVGFGGAAGFSIAFGGSGTMTDTMIFGCSLGGGV